MLLDKLLAHLELEVEPFALCEIHRGWALRLAPPADVVLHFVLAGRGELVVTPSGRYPIGADCLVVVPPGMAHAIDCEGTAGCVVRADSREIARDSGVHRVEAGEGERGLVVACGRVHATYGGLSGLFDRLPAPLIQDFSDSPVVRGAFTQLLEESQSPQPGVAEMASALMYQCFVLLLRRLCESRDCRIAWLDAVTDTQLARALDAMHEHPERRHSVASLASAAGLSRSSFGERFTRAFERSPMEYLREVRLQRGARLLKTTDLGVQQIARKVGFASRSHFSQAFAGLYGRPPADYRAGA